MKEILTHMKLNDGSRITLSVEKSPSCSSFFATHSSRNPLFESLLTEEDRTEYEKIKQFLLEL